MLHLVCCYEHHNTDSAIVFIHKKKKKELNLQKIKFFHTVLRLTLSERIDADKTWWENFTYYVSMHYVELQLYLLLCLTIKI